jgi:hypothetical protein
VQIAQQEGRIFGNPEGYKPALHFTNKIHSEKRRWGKIVGLINQNDIKEL